MPPRWLTLTIVVFWAATTCWLVQKEIAPRLRAGDPPPYTFDLTDEVSGPAVQWRILQKGKQVGSGSSSVRRLPDRTFKLHSEFTFTDLDLLPILSFKKMSSLYIVTPEGELREVGATILGNVAHMHLEIHVSGKVEDGYLAPLVKGMGFPTIHMPKVAVPVNVLNPMHLLSKINGLHEGQTWTTPLLDTAQAIMPEQSSHSLSMVEAEVSNDLLTWNKEEVPCFKIEYRPIGKDRVMARTWVRQRDGLVLQQEANYNAMELVFRRNPNKL